MTGRSIDRRGVALGGGLLLALAGRAGAQNAVRPASAVQQPAPRSGPQATPPTGAQAGLGADIIQSQTDAADRLTVKVMLNGQGPYPFVVDTGAERSALSAEVAAELMLTPGPPIIVHGVAGQITSGSAVVEELSVGARKLKGVVMPLLKRADVGAAGVLGIDALQYQRVELDFLHREIVVRASTERLVMSDEIVVAAKSRFGQLVLVDASFNHTPVLVVVDTGAEKSIGNLALKRRVKAENMVGEEQALIYSVTGQTTTGQWALIDNVQIGGFGVNRMPVVFADLHAFERWRLTDQPALLLGMDVLRQFDRVDIDFARREVRFRGAGAWNNQRFASNPWRMG